MRRSCAKSRQTSFNRTTAVAGHAYAWIAHAKAGKGVREVKGGRGFGMKGLRIQDV